MLNVLRGIFWGTPIRKAVSIMTAFLILPAWALNYEAWLQKNEYDKLLVDPESPLFSFLSTVYQWGVSATVFLASSGFRWFICGAFVALTLDGGWRAWKARNGNGRAKLESQDEEQPFAAGTALEGRSRITLKEAGCLLAGVDPTMFDNSPKAQSIANEMLYYAIGAYVRPADMSPRQHQMLRQGREDHGYDLKAVSLETFITTAEFHRYQNPGWRNGMLPVVEAMNRDKS